MKSLIRFAVVALSLVVALPGGLRAETYEVDRDFSPALPEGLKFGSVSGVAVDGNGYLIVAHRGERPILVYDPSGKLVQMFGDGELKMVHGLRIDSDNNIWVTDIEHHVAIKYSPSGKVLLTLGKRGVAGDDEATFNRPTDVAIAPGGEIFVSDGYGNNRIVKFTKDGKFVKAWGTRGKEDGQLNLPHCAQFDSKGLLHVADRENDRVQVFDQEGQLVRKYDGFAPFGLLIAPDQTVYVADGRAHECVHLAADGKVLAKWGSKGEEPGQLGLPHCLALDRSGNVYVGEIEGKRLQRFVRK